MPIQPRHADICDDVDRILHSASEMMHYVTLAYRMGSLRLEHLDATLALRDDMISMLAKFEDGECYGMVGPAAISAMRSMEITASGLIDAVCCPETEARNAA